MFKRDLTLSRQYFSSRTAIRLNVLIPDNQRLSTMKKIRKLIILFGTRLRTYWP